jgi:hypothetical protein
MKRFIRNVTVFFLLTLLLAFAEDAFLSGVLKRSKAGENSVWYDLYNGRINSKVVIYGASRAWVHFDPEIIQDSLHLSAYNLGIDGHNFWLQYFRHKILFEYNTRPKLIIQSVEAATLSKRPDLYNQEQFLPYMLNNSEMEEATRSYEGFTFFDYHIPMLRYYGHFEELKRAFLLFTKPSSNIPDRIRGYKGQDISWNDDFEKARKKMKSMIIKPDTATIRLFENFLQECVGKGIKVILVYSPEYIEGQMFTLDRARIVNLYKGFADKYKIPFYDYSNDSISFQKKYFYNSQHMNKEGAELFTKKLVSDIRVREKSWLPGL